MSAEVANETKIIFQNATSGGKELYPVVLIQTKKNTFVCQFNDTESDSTVHKIMFPETTTNFSLLFSANIKNKLHCLVDLFCMLISI